MCLGIGNLGAVIQIDEGLGPVSLQRTVAVARFLLFSDASATRSGTLEIAML